MTGNQQTEKGWGNRRYQRLDRADYDRVNEFLRDRAWFTAREWAVARLCADFRTATGAPMKKIGKEAPDLVPFIDREMARGDVGQARHRFEQKVRKSVTTALYGANSGVFAPDELDDIFYEGTETARLLIDVEGSSIPVDRERDAEDRFAHALREIREASAAARHQECPHCGGDLQMDPDHHETATDGDSS